MTTTLCTWTSNERAIKAKQVMDHLQIPTPGPQVLDRKIIDLLKTLFSPLVNNDPNPGFGFGSLSVDYTFTLESYWVDKHLSSHIDSKFIKEAITRIERAVNEQLNKTCKPFDRRTFFVGFIDSLGNAQDPDFSSSKEIRRERYFLMRVVKRLSLNIERKLIQENPPPPQIDTDLFRQGSQKLGYTFQVPGWLGFEQEPLLTIYTEYCNKIHDLRDTEIVKFLKEMWEQDQEVRQTNPTAPLLHLTLLPNYEQSLAAKISQAYQKQLYLQKALLTGVFFCAMLLSHIYSIALRGLTVKYLL